MPSKKKPAKKSKPAAKRTPPMTLSDVCNVLEGIDTRLAESLVLFNPGLVERLIAAIERLSTQIEKEQVEQLPPPIEVVEETTVETSAPVTDTTTS